MKMKTRMQGSEDFQLTENPLNKTHYVTFFNLYTKRQVMEIMLTAHNYSFKVPLRKDQYHIVGLGDEKQSCILIRKSNQPKLYLLESMTKND